MLKVCVLSVASNSVCSCVQKIVSALTSIRNVRATIVSFLFFFLNLCSPFVCSSAWKAYLYNGNFDKAEVFTHSDRERHSDNTGKVKDTQREQEALIIIFINCHFFCYVLTLYQDHYIPIAKI